MTAAPDVGTRDEDAAAPEGESERKRGPRGWWKRRSKRARRLFVVLVAVPCLVIIAAAGLFYAMTEVPLPESINTAEVSTVTYRDGKTEMMKIGSINRTNVPLSAVSLDAQHAVIAAED